VSVKIQGPVQSMVKATYFEVDFTLQLGTKAQKDSRVTALIFLTSALDGVGG
jgi:hypothetical protein